MAKKKTALVAIIVAVALVVVSVGGVFTYKKVIVPNKKYNNAKSLLEKGEYEKAAKSFKALGKYKDSKKMIEKCRFEACGGEEAFNKIVSLEIGKKITLGSYEQDGDLTNGAEPLEWTVLDKVGNKVLVTVGYAIDAKPYCEDTSKGYGWDNSSLRKWLNGEFLESAFSESEAKMISKTHLEPEIPNEELITATFNATDDKLFVFSIEEAKKYFPETEEEAAKKGTVKSRKLKPTPYALINNVYTAENGCCIWWLRDVSLNGTLGINVRTNGAINSGDNSLTSSRGGVRPCMWLGVNF